MSGFFITGTDTGIGKTYTTVLLARQLIKQGYRVAALKPVASGASWIVGQLRNDDALQLQAVSNVELSYAEVNPFCFKQPLPPHIAASQQHVEIDLSVITKQIAHAQSCADIVLVEGVGGWQVPLRDAATVADLAKQIDFPVLLVVGLRLGCLNHALLSATAIINSGCELAGWIGNVIDPDYAVTNDTLAYLRTYIPAENVGVISYQSKQITQQKEGYIAEIFDRQKT